MGELKHLTEPGIVEVVMKLTGPIKPVGESSANADRFENLETFMAVTERLLTELEGVAISFNNSPRASEERAGTSARRFLLEIAKNIASV